MSIQTVDALTKDLHCIPFNTLAAAACFLPRFPIYFLSFSSSSSTFILVLLILFPLPLCYQRRPYWMFSLTSRARVSSSDPELQRVNCFTFASFFPYRPCRRRFVFLFYFIFLFLSLTLLFLSFSFYSLLFHCYYFHPPTAQLCIESFVSSTSCGDGNRQKREGKKFLQQ